uniref:Uncharacterized protein n=1 Tax=Ditylenchus dipsaci TaxID=166011 RepID=A0A915D972_9BILA
MTFNRLERIMCSYLEPVNDLTTMLKYGAKPLQIVAVCYNDHLKDLKTRNILNRLLKFVNNNCEFRSEMDTRSEVGVHGKSFFGSETKAILNAAETAFRTCTKILGDQVHGVRSYEKLLPFVNNRMKRLLEILRPYEPNTRSKSTVKDPLFGLVFVEQRYVAYVINVLLKMLAKWEPKDGTLVDTDEANAAHKRQESVLQKFRNGTLNLLVCTSVLEEGIDVRQCNLVVRYDPPTDFRSFVQSRGRARKENGTYCILTSEKERWRIDEELRVYAQVEEFILKRYKFNKSPRIYVKCHFFNQPVLLKLPSDVFTRLVPQSKHILDYNLGHPASTKAHALMAVALKGCQKLHERNELNDHLLPMGKDTVANLLSELDDEDLPYISMKTGSMSKHVLDTLPQPNVPCYVYLIDMKLTKPISEEGNPKKRRILDPSQVDSAFGFLSTKTFHQCPTFQSFNVRGKWKGGVEFAPEHSPIPLLVVPLKRVRSIVDGCCVEEYQLDHKNLSLTIREPPTTPSDEVRQHFKFDEAKFYDAVVMPWYRPNLPNTYYYVAEICRDQNPSTGFPDEKFSSFNQYFMAKYQLKIYDQQQNLWMWTIHPSQRQVLVPELVHIHPLSSPLWTMLIALPTVMYRMNSLLLADELRCRVMSEAFGIESEIPRILYGTNHLKRIISAEKEKEQSPSKSSLNVSMHSENGEDEDRMDTDSFCIGVWDPEDAVEFQNPDPILNSNGAQPMGDEAISESIAMGSNYSIHNFAEMSDEEDEEAYDILLDLKMTMHEKLAHLKEPFEPREVNVQFPLAISGNSNEINVASLMKDLETNLGRNAFESSAGTKNEYSTSGPKGELKERKLDSQDGAMLETNQEGHSLGLLEGLQIVRDETLPESFILSEFINTKFAVSAPELGWMKFSFEDEFLDKNPFGVSPSLLLQALTTSSAAMALIWRD